MDLDGVGLEASGQAQQSLASFLTFDVCCIELEIGLPNSVTQYINDHKSVHGNHGPKEQS